MRKAIVALCLCGSGLFLPSVARASTTAPAAPGNTGLQTYVDLPTSYYDDAAVNVANGNLLVSSDDSASNAITNDIPLYRFYNSQASPSSPNVGFPNWTLSAGAGSVYLIINTSSVVAHMPDGATVTFAEGANNTFSTTSSSARLVYTPANATTGTPASYTLFDSLGNQDVFNSSGVETSETPYDDPDAITVSSAPAFTGGAQALYYLTDGTTGAKIHISYNASATRTPQIASTSQISSSSPQQANSGYVYGAQSSQPLTGFYQPSQAGLDQGPEVTYTYNAADQLSGISEPDGTSEAISYSGNLVTSLQVTPPTGAPYGYTFSYQAANSSVCAVDDIGETTVTDETGAVTTYCYTAQGVVDVTTGSTGLSDSYTETLTPTTAKSSDKAAPVVDNYHELLTPTRVAPVAPAEPEATTTDSHTFNISRSQYNYDVFGKTGLLSTQVGSRSSPTRLNWGWIFNLKLVSLFTSQVTENATLYLLSNGQKVNNYTDHHVEDADYLFHSSVPNVGDGRVYQLALNFTGSCQPPSPNYRCTIVDIVKFNFSIKQPNR